MLQSLSSTVSSIMVLFSLVAWRAKNNFRDLKNYGEFDDIKNSLAIHQWRQDNSIPVTDITDGERSAELAERQTKLDGYKALVNPTPEQLTEFEVFKELYLKPGTEEFIVPIYSGNAGFRRASTFFAAMVQRAGNRKDGVPNPISGLVPVRPTVYETTADRIFDQQMENEMIGLGAVKMADLDKLKVTMALYREGCREVRVRQLYSSSTGQKTYGICEANQNWPSLNIYDRFMQASETPGYIPWGPVRGDVLVKMNNRFEADRKRAEGLPLKKDERALEPIPLQEVTDYFNDRAKLATGDGNAGKSMAKKDMEAGSKNHKLKLVRKVFDSVIGNTQANLKTFMDHDVTLNTITDLIQEPTKATATDRIVLGLNSHFDVYDGVAKAIDAGKGEELVKFLISLFPVETVVIQKAPETVAPATAPVVPVSVPVTETAAAPAPVEAPAATATAEQPSSEPVVTNGGKHSKNKRS